MERKFNKSCELPFFSNVQTNTFHVVKLSVDSTAVGAPARIIGFTPKGESPGSNVDSRLVDIEPLSGLADSLVGSTITKSATDTSLSTATTAEMQATSISEEQLESSSSDIESDEKNADVPVVQDSKKDEYEEGDGENDSNEDDSNEEDDKLTDFGTPAKYFAKTSKDDSMCPFSGAFRKCPRTLPEDWISHEKIHTLLTQQGCSDGECVEVFFELLHLLPPNSTARKYGCIPADVFSKHFVDIAQEKTSLDLVTCQALANGDLRALGWSKKASKSFRCLFSKLGNKSARALSKISSASDMLSSSMHEKNRSKKESAVSN